jgi:hypothetical protein
MNETANPILFKFKMKLKILTFKSLQWMHRKFPAKQCNRQNVILFHETIPLNVNVPIPFPKIERTVQYV